MSEENKVVIEEKCFCKSKFFRNFAAITLGTFIGGFCALNLFFALNKPPVMPMMFHPVKYYSHMPYHPGMGDGFIRKHSCDCPCHKKHIKKFMDNKKLLKETQENKD